MDVRIGIEYGGRFYRSIGLVAMFRRGLDTSSNSQKRRKLQNIECAKAVARKRVGGGEAKLRLSTAASVKLRSNKFKENNRLFEPSQVKRFGL